MSSAAAKRNPAEHLAPHQFKPGQVANPNGRPVGSRNKLCDAYLQKMHADFLEHGDSVIKEVRETKPEVYLLAIGALVPKQKQEVNSPFTDLSDDELDALEKYLKASRAKNVTPPTTIDAKPEPSKPEPIDPQTIKHWSDVA